MPAVIVASACTLLAPASSAVAANPFAIDSFSLQTTQAREVPREAGKPGTGFVQEPYAYTQAAGHPDGLTSSVVFATERLGEPPHPVPSRDPKDLTIELPPGLIANPFAIPRCPHERFERHEECPADTQVGTYVDQLLSERILAGPIVNLEPEAGQAAELALESHLFDVVLRGRLIRTPAGYALSVVAANLPNLEVVSLATTLWGVPGAQAHDGERGLFCEGEATSGWSCEGGGQPGEARPAPFLTLPSACTAGPLTATASADSWEQPGQWVSARAMLPSGSPGGFGGCAALPFSPSFQLQPETELPDQPFGLTATVAAPQGESSQPAPPPLREIAITLPQGVSLSPAGTDGLRACPATGPEGIDIPTGLNAAGEAWEPGEAGEGIEASPDGIGRLAPGHCPDASRIGTAQALTPLFASALEGSVYLAPPDCGGALPPCEKQDAADGGLYRVWVELGGTEAAGETGLDLKLAGYLQADPGTGQLTLRLRESPQLPLSRVTIELNGGPRALLDSPPGCGEASASAELVPWSAPGVTPEGLLVTGTPSAEAMVSYPVAGCPPAPTLAPGFLAGSVDPAAGRPTPFSLNVSREDGEQPLSRLRVALPAGLTGMLASVTPCSQAAAATGACPAAARIGSSLVAAGAGSHPLELAGTVYLTGPYAGAPFGLEIVTRVLAGPFDLGTIVVRAAVDVDPRTGALTVTSDPFPPIVLGVPLRLRRIELTLDRPGFVLNPTACGAKRVGATVAGGGGASATASSPFYLYGCGALTFAPKLRASASGRPGGPAALELRLALPGAGVGTANFARAAVTLPRRLAIRLASLRHACDEAVFAADPSACPQAAVVGIARARTPVLRGRLAGPIYLVSHGARALPSLVVVLQGEGVRLDLHGSTSVSRGAVSIAFDSLPDVPVQRLDAYLAPGPRAVLGAGGDLCSLHRTVSARRIRTVRVRGRLVRRRALVRRRIAHSTLLATTLAAHNGLLRRVPTVLWIGGCGR